MKKCFSILLAMLLLCGSLCVGASAAKKSQPADALAQFDFKEVAKSLGIPASWITVDFTKMSDEQIMNYMNILKTMGINPTVLKLLAGNFPFAMKRTLHRAGIIKFPIYERSAFFHWIFKWIFFGWIWMK